MKKDWISVLKIIEFLLIRKTRLLLKVEKRMTISYNCDGYDNKEMSTTFYTMKSNSLSLENTPSKGKLGILTWKEFFLVVIF
jgi:hypothetical protein